uniref:EF-hand domain-containing protein n=1 Tax=Rhabditophanes sp. KR3021 TaxID=114890 RepID=A0AC35UBF8_9BILA
MFAKSSTTFVKVIDSPHRRRSSEVDRVVHRRFKQAPALFKNHPALNGCLERIYWSARAIQYRLCFEDKDGEFDSLIDTAAIEPNIKPPNMDILRKKTGYLFSEKWLKYSYQRFKSECPTGRMNLTDFKRLFGKFVPSERVSDGYLERLFSAFTGDLSVLENEDGEEEKSKAVLSFEGLVCALATLQSSSSESYAEWILKLMRKNPDERVSYKEFAEFVKSIYELSGKKVSKNLDLINYQASATFDELDVEREGFLDYQKFKHLFQVSKIVIP